MYYSMLHICSRLINSNSKYLKNFNKYKIMKYNYMFRQKSKKEIPFHEKHETINPKIYNQIIPKSSSKNKKT